MRTWFLSLTENFRRQRKRAYNCCPDSCLHGPSSLAPVCGTGIEIKNTFVCHERRLRHRQIIVTPQLVIPPQIVTKQNIAVSKSHTLNYNQSVSQLIINGLINWYPDCTGSFNLTVCICSPIISNQHSEILHATKFIPSLTLQV